MRPRKIALAAFTLLLVCVIVEGSVRALDRIGRVLEGLCSAKTLSPNPEFQQALNALGAARIRFANEPPSVLLPAADCPKALIAPWISAERAVSATVESAVEPTASFVVSS